MRLYRAILRMLAPLLAAQVLVQRLRGRVGPEALAERFGMGRGGRADLWLHGASNGELASARWIIERIRAARPDLGLIITCNSWSAREMVAGWQLAGVAVRLAPLDTPGAVRRFRRAWGVRGLITLENELWPERTGQMAEAGPVICLGARMSESSARNWARLAPRLIAATLGRFSLISAQDAASERRLLDLGLPPDRLGPRLMLKAHGQPLARPDGRTMAGFSRSRVLLAASSHEGEEEIVLQGFAQAHAAGAFDLLILAPRHPRRSAEVRALIQATGLSHATRSLNEPVTDGVAVYLADTLGEMAQWYDAAGATIVCGTFGPAGGHTPFEPAAHGSAILHGPDVPNFAEAFAALDAEGAALPVTAATLGPTLCSLDADRQDRLARQARAVLAPADEGALVAAVLACLPAQARG